jgi:hypothetical protein
MKMQFRVDVGLLILFLAFVAFFWGFLEIGIDLAEHRIIYILEADSSRYSDYMRDAFFFCILPPAAGLAFSIIALAKIRKSPTRFFDRWLPIVVAGGFFFLLGAYGLWWTYTHYLDVIHWVNAYGYMNIADLTLKICLAVIVGHILWMLAGILFMLSPCLKRCRRKDPMNS